MESEEPATAEAPALVERDAVREPLADAGAWSWRPCPRVATGTGICDGQWCWVTPRPHGHALHALAAVAPDDVWAAGDYGVVQHFDGQRWTYSYVEGHPNLFAIWADASGDVWVAGERGALARRSGSGWANLPLGATTWRALGGAANDLWLAGGAQAVRWDGRRWTVHTVPTNTTVVALWLRAPGDVWLVDALGRLYRSAGGAPFAALSPGPGNFFATSIWGNAPNDVWLGGLRTSGSQPGALQHFDGVGWTAAPVPTRHVVALSGGWALGQGHSGELELHRLQAGRWSLVESRSTHGWETRSVGALGVLPGDEVWAVGQSGMTLHRTPAGVDFEPPLAADDLRSVWTDGDDVVAAGLAVVVHRRRGEWRCIETDALVRLMGVWASGADDVWAVGRDRYRAVALHFDGQHWSEQPLSEDFIGRPEAGLATAVHGTGPRDVWVVGTEGLVRHFDGTGWRGLDAGTARHLRGVAAVAPDDVWAVGDHGVALHWDGARWSPFNLGGQLTSVVAFGPSDVWALSSSAVHRWDGAGWQHAAALSPFSGATFIGGTSAADLWIAGGAIWVPDGRRATLLRGDGFAWRPVRASTSEPRFSLAFAPDGGVLSAGAGGSLLWAQ